MKNQPLYVFRVMFEKGSYIILAPSVEDAKRRCPDCISVKLVDTYKHMCKNTR